MIKRLAIAGCAAILIVFTARAQTAQRPPARTTASTPLMQPEAQTAMVQQYCAGCHNSTTKSGGLVLAGFDFAHVEQHAEIAEKMIRKLRVGMMPPPGAKRPD